MEGRKKRIKKAGNKKSAGWLWPALFLSNKDKSELLYNIILEKDRPIGCSHLLTVLLWLRLLNSLVMHGSLQSKQ
jgi:hypothetical protein